MPVGGFLLDRRSSLEAYYQRPHPEGPSFLSHTHSLLPWGCSLQNPSLLCQLLIRGSVIKSPEGRSGEPWRVLSSSHPPPACVLVFRTQPELLPFQWSPPTAVAGACSFLSPQIIGLKASPLETWQLQLRLEPCLSSVFPAIGTSGSLVIPWLQPSVH